MVRDANGRMHARDGRWTNERMRLSGGMDLEGGYAPAVVDADEAVMGGVAKAEALARMGDRQGADRVAAALGALSERELRDWHGPAGGRTAVWDGRGMYSVTLDADGGIIRDDVFDPASLPRPSRETMRHIASIPVGVRR